MLSNSARLISVGLAVVACTLNFGIGEVIVLGILAEALSFLLSIYLVKRLCTIRYRFEATFVLGAVSCLVILLLSSFIFAPVQSWVIAFVLVGGLAFCTLAFLSGLPIFRPKHIQRTIDKG